MHFAERGTLGEDVPVAGRVESLPSDDACDRLLDRGERVRRDGCANDPVVEVRCADRGHGPADAEALSPVLRLVLPEHLPVRVWGSDWLLENTVDGTCAPKSG